MSITLQHNQRVSQLVDILFCVLLLILMSQVKIPLHPVPITLQTVAVMIIGIQFSCKIGLYSILMYLLLGSVGLPAFVSSSAGYTYLIGPTGGYLVGFLAAIVVMHYVKKVLNSTSLYHDKSLHTFLSCLAGLVVIFIFGVSWFATFVGIKQAILLGLVPFIVPGIIKTFLLVAILKYLNCQK